MLLVIFALWRFFFFFHYNSTYNLWVLPWNKSFCAVRMPKWIFNSVHSLVTSGKESICQCRRHEIHGFNSWVRKVPWSRKWQPTPVFLPGESHGQRTLVGYSPWVAKNRTRLSKWAQTQARFLSYTIRGGISLLLLIWISNSLADLLLSKCIILVYIYIWAVSICPLERSPWWKPRSIKGLELSMNIPNSHHSFLSKFLSSLSCSCRREFLGGFLSQSVFGLLLFLLTWP